MNICLNCGHEHAGRELAYICIGCPCPDQPGKAAGDSRPAPEPAPYCAECGSPAPLHNGGCSQRSRPAPEPLSSYARLQDALQSQAFYEVMQAYRHAPLLPPDVVVTAFEAVKTWLLREATPPAAQEPPAKTLAGLLRHIWNGPAPAAQEPPVNAHTLTLEFGRFLSEPEWREIVGRARGLPYVQGLRADAVNATPPPPAAQEPPDPSDLLASAAWSRSLARRIASQRVALDLPAYVTRPAPARAATEPVDVKMLRDALGEWWCCDADYPNHEPTCPNAAREAGETCDPMVGDARRLRAESEQQLIDCQTLSARVKDALATSGEAGEAPPRTCACGHVEAHHDDPDCGCEFCRCVAFVPEAGAVRPAQPKPVIGPSPFTSEKRADDARRFSSDPLVNVVEVRPAQPPQGDKDKG